MKVTLTVLSIAALVAAAVIFVLFMVDVGRLGGDALSGHWEYGHADDGRWFVSDHGRATEVSEADWSRNRTLGILMWTTFPVGMLSFFFLLFALALPRAIFRAPADERDARVRAVEASGPAIATSKGGGGFRWIGVGKGLLRADVHPGGLVVRARLIGSAAVRASELTAIRPRTGLLQHAVTVEHTSPHVVSPIHLALRRETAFVDALKSIGAPKT